MVPAVPVMAPRVSMRWVCQWQGQPQARGSADQGRERARLQASSRRPYNWKERWEWGCAAGEQGVWGSLSESSSCCCTPGYGLSSPGCDFTASTSLPLQATAFSCASSWLWELGWQGAAPLLNAPAGSKALTAAE